MNSSAFLDNLRQLFSECDTDKNGSLGRQEFGELCKKIGLNSEAANETFVRLDIDRDGKISFDEFAAGFNQYKQTAVPAGPAATKNNNHPPARQQNSSSSNSTSNIIGSISTTVSKDSDCDHYADAQSAPVASTSRLGGGGGQVSPKPTPRHASPSGRQLPERLTPSPLSARSKKGAASQIGVLSLGSTGSSSNSSGNLLTASSSSGGGGSLRSISMTTTTSLQSGASADTSSWPLHRGAASSSSNSLQQEHSTSGGQDGAGRGVVVYSGDHMLGANGGGGGGGGFMATTPSNDSYDCYTDGYGQASGGSAGGDQFGSLLSQNSATSYSQVKTMQDLLECVQKLQNENQILTQIFFKDKREREEYISQLGEEFDQQLKEVEERANRRAREELENEKRRLEDMMQTERETLQHHYQTLEKISKFVRTPNGKLDADGEGTIDKVKSKLEDTFVENRQLKRSLLDTKTDVALIWKEMEKLKKQYEDKLSSAYEKHNETKSECDHIKQQLNLMKDSNRRLQDASDVITNYITDKVEPVIKVANSEQDFLGLPNTGGAANNQLFNKISPNNSRRGSILSEYLDGGGGGDDNDNDDQQCANVGGQGKGTPSTKQQDLKTSISANQLSSSAGGSRQDAEPHRSLDNDSVDKQSIDGKQQQQQPQQEPASTATTTAAAAAAAATSVDSNQKSGIRNLGKHFFLGSRASLSAASSSSSSDLAAKLKGTTADQRPTETTKSDERAMASAAVDNAADKGKPISASTDSDEPSVEPADGPSKATFNIILVGDSFVGKSSFAARFMEGSFVQGLISNCSIDFKTKSYKVDGSNYTINLWDTAGQERFRSITASYFRKADGIILMYDVTDKRSYLNVRNWMSTISDTAAENVAVLLVGNKIDLRQNDNKYKCVPTEEGFRLAKEYEIVFLETSVKTGTNLLPSMGRLIRLIAKNNTEDEEEDKDRIRLNDKSRTFNCMPKNC